MKLRYVLLCLFLLFPIAVTSSTDAEWIRVTGFFSSMHYVEESGDVVGMEVFISYSFGLQKDDYWVVFQIAEGMPAPPVLVKAAVTEDMVDFTLPASAGSLGTFKGKVTSEALVGKFSGMHESLRLVRGKSYWQ